MKYYRILPDNKLKGVWFLKGPIGKKGEYIDPRVFTDSVFYEGVTPYEIPLRREGAPLNFTFADFDMCIVEKTILNDLKEIDYQAFPVKVFNEYDKYVILNVLEKYDCLDRERSEFVDWDIDSGQPEKVGEIRMVTKLVIDGSKIIGKSLFRVNEWQCALICNQDLKETLQSKVTKGLRFEQVL